MTISPQSTCYSTPVCEILSKWDHPSGGFRGGGGRTCPPPFSQSQPVRCSKSKLRNYITVLDETDMNIEQRTVLAINDRCMTSVNISISPPPWSTTPAPSLQFHPSLPSVPTSLLSLLRSPPKTKLLVSHTVVCNAEPRPQKHFGTFQGQQS